MSNNLIEILGIENRPAVLRGQVRIAIVMSEYVWTRRESMYHSVSKLPKLLLLTAERLGKVSIYKGLEALNIAVFGFMNAPSDSIAIRQHVNDKNAPLSLCKSGIPLRHVRRN